MEIKVGTIFSGPVDIGPRAQKFTADDNASTPQVFSLPDWKRLYGVKPNRPTAIYVPVYAVSIVQERYGREHVKEAEALPDQGGRYVPLLDGTVMLTLQTSRGSIPTRAIWCLMANAGVLVAHKVGAEVARVAYLNKEAVMALEDGVSDGAVSESIVARAANASSRWLSVEITSDNAGKSVGRKRPPKEEEDPGVTGDDITGYDNTDGMPG